MTTVAATGDEDTDETTAALAAIADNFDKAEVIISLYESDVDTSILSSVIPIIIPTMLNSPKLFER